MDVMRIVVLIAALGALFSAPARAETRTFIVGNNPDGYGVDRCLANGDRCGVPVARAYCQAQEFAQAVSFRKVEGPDVTGTIATAHGESCRGTCIAYIAIECAR
jgi:hypothetical protein